MYEFFLKVHFILAFIALVALLNHLGRSGLDKLIFPIAALSIWGMNALVRLLIVLYRNTGGWQQRGSAGSAKITHFFDSAGENVVSAMRVKLYLRRPQKIRPGQYYYLSFSDMGLRKRFQSHPYTIAWWDDSMRATSLSFLVQPHNGVSSDLIRRNSLRSVRIDGPYGKDLELEKYETVILVAKGIGIAGIIPYVRHLAYRKLSTGKAHEAYRRGLITRKIDVYWMLEDNAQEDWISDWIIDLREKDSQKASENFMLLIAEITDSCTAYSNFHLLLS